MTRLPVLLLAAVSLAAPAFAADVVVDLAASDPADPGSGWTAFNAAQGTPGKPFVFRFESTDSTALPLSASGACAAAGGACVRLRPGTSAGFGTAKECARLPPMTLEPEFDATTAGGCFYRLSSSGSYTEVVIYHLGLLEPNADVRVEILNLTPALPFHDFVDFDTDDPAVSPNGAPSPGPSRPAANLVVVVDKSGSMGWSNNPSLPGCAVLSAPPPGCEPARWEVLNAALEQMGAVAKAYALPGDEIGAVAFDSSATVVQPLLGANAATIDAVVSAIETSFSPGGGTSIGDGVDELADALAQNVGENNLMLLFSDGVQNNPFYLRLVGGVLRINEDSDADTGSNVRDLPTNFDLCVFALRTAGEKEPLDLQGISDVRCDGLVAETASVDPTDPELVAFFLQALNAALVGDKLEMVSIDVHRIPRRSRGELRHDFTVGRDSIGLTASIGWANRGNGLETMALVNEDGVSFRAFDDAVTNRTERGETSQTMTLRTPACGRDAAGGRVCLEHLGGDWTLLAHPVFEVSDVFEARSFVVSDNASLATAFAVEETGPALDAPLRLTARLSEAGQPIAGLPEGSVRAVVRAPGGNRGDVLAGLNVSPAPIQVDSDPQTAAALKALTALASPTLGAELRKAITLGAGVEVMLREVSPGVYVGEAAAEVEGAYAVRFEVEAPDAKLNGPFDRTFLTTFIKDVPIDAAATLATLTAAPVADCAPERRCVRLTLAPQDADGVLVGPNFGPVISVGGGAEPFGAVQDNLDGSYTLVAACPEFGDCRPTISIRQDGVAPELPGPDGPRRELTWDVKMLCGVQPDPDGPLADGRYATLVNLLALERPARVKLTFASAVPRQKPGSIGSRRLAAGQAVAVSCDRLARFVLGARGGGFVDGVVTIESDAPLSVTAVYSATAAQPERAAGVAPSLEIREVRPRGR